MGLYSMPISEKKASCQEKHRVDRITIMRQVKLECKKYAAKILPDRVFGFVKKRHYLSIVRSFSLEHAPDLKIVQYLVKPNDYVIDIGANIGAYSKVLSELVGKDGHVYSIEPYPSTFEILCYITRKMNLRNVEPINVAISDFDGVATMALPYNPSGAETHYRAHIVIDNIKESIATLAKVQATTIDSQFLQTSGKISFIKCDVEGHELSCLRGSNRFLQHAQPAWLIETCGDPDDPNSQTRLVFDILSGKDYSAWWFDGKRLIERCSGDISINYFFLTDEHINTLRNVTGRLSLVTREDSRE